MGQQVYLNCNKKNLFNQYFWLNIFLDWIMIKRILNENVDYVIIYIKPEAMWSNHEQVNCLSVWPNSCVLQNTEETCG